MLIEILKIIFERDLQKLKNEIELYHDDEAMWFVDEGISNSGGNLCLHIIGNLNAYIGVGLAKTDYVRKRDLEFSLKNIPKTELIEKIEQTLLTVENGLNKLTIEQLNDDFPVVIWGKPTQMGYTLVHLTTHLSYHLGQINYHRRLFDN
ncbi:DUF1572 family protein [Flavobacterium soyangense]|uniref:DUF1572 family protein n=1 Tax=Flavobacterium soyangense TaxID=2023265 RepID=A0A930UAS3_9FLAO|nr:DUF1572 family protein [Flavobacterium soyangense]MBF2707876.1 DUF1572 family protein [Flavobacterium soyangense]